jgi:hypothetical protein
MRNFMGLAKAEKYANEHKPAVVPIDGGDKASDAADALD